MVRKDYSWAMFKRKSQQSTAIMLSGIPIKITRKNVKNINIRVYAAKQEVRISAPYHVRMKTIRAFAASKMPWIQKHLAHYKEPQQADLKYESGEQHLVWGKGVELQVCIHQSPPKVNFDEEKSLLKMRVRRGTGTSKRANILKEWYRAELKKEIPMLIDKWEPQMDVSVNEFGVKQMKTRWGSCNTRAKRIWLNLELAKKSPACLEYVVVHEMVHLLERLHNKRFYGFMDKFLPGWQDLEKELQGKVD